MAAPYVEASRDDDDYGKKASKTSKKSKVKIEVKYDFETGLLRCEDVDQPTVLSSCGTDRLIGGKVEIEKDGTVGVHVAGAEASATYDVLYVSFDGLTTLPIGTIATDLNGNARQKWVRFFTLGDTGVGNVVLQRNNLDQFVSGFEVIR